jgi:16S rRNA (adenine1518-N6/adenine1519-N6)-dimethyltransferase
MIYSKKSLGQNFLIDQNITKKIISLVKIQNKNILEIGPGHGALTDEILKQNPKSLILIEKDYGLVKKLEEKYLNNKIIKILNADVLDLDLEKKINSETVVYGNLPYNISSQILVKFLRFNENPSRFSDLVLMFQKEVAEKIVGKKNSNNYGRLSILTNYKLKIFNTFIVSNNCFLPKPKITSCVVHFKPDLKINFNIKNIKNLEKITNIFFSNKRKMINKNIKKLFKIDLFKKEIDINLSSRPSDLDPEVYYKITELYEKEKKPF